MAESDIIPRSLKTTGYYTEAVIGASLLTIPPLLILFGSLGVVLMLVRTVLFRSGKGGVN
tara:strand:+ start:128 stop:307 length:180 start_codon:yes stop_codon:yes gene_type:complete